MKAAATDATVCRDLFFDEQTSLEDVANYLPLLTADAQVGLNVGHFTRNLPSKEADFDGVAFWLEGSDTRMLVIGAVFEETAHAQIHPHAELPYKLAQQRLQHD